MLGFPSETSKAQCVIGFRHWNLRERPTLCGWFGVDVVLKCLVSNTLNETIAQGARGDTERFDGFGSGDVLHNVRIRSASMNQLPARGVNECAICDVAGSEFHFLAERTDID